MNGFVHIRVFNDFDLSPIIQPLMSFLYGEVIMSTIISYYIQNLCFHQYALRSWGIFVVMLCQARETLTKFGWSEFSVYMVST